MEMPTSFLPFKISRIRTESGIFNVDGYRSPVSTNKIISILSQLFILSTDSREELTSPQSDTRFIKKLRPYLEHHLLSNR